MGSRRDSTKEDVMEIELKLKKHHIKVPAVIHFDFDPPSPHEGMSYYLGMHDIEIDPEDAKNLLKELIEERVEKVLWDTYELDVVDDLKEIEL